MAVSILAPVAIVGLLALAALAVGSLMVGKSGIRFPSLRHALFGAVSLLWFVPVIGVLLWVAVAATHRLSVPHESAVDVAITEESQGHAEAVHEVATAASTATEANSTPALPEWVSQPRQDQGDRTLLVFSSKQHTTVDEAEDEALAAARRAVEENFRREHAAADWKVPAPAVEKLAVRKSYQESVEREFGAYTVTMHRVHLQVEVSPQINRALYPEYRSHVVVERSSVLLAVLAAVTLMLGTTAGYFWLDGLTGGAYRSRLKLAAVSVVSAGGIAAATFLHTV